MESYEKKYKEALAKAKEQYNYPCMKSCMGILEEIFPELKESEDERIKKRIIQALHGDVLEMDEIKEAEIWLEKQGKQPNINPDDLVLDFTKRGVSLTSDQAAIYRMGVEDVVRELKGEQKSINDLSPQEAMEIAVAKCFEQGEQKPIDFSNLRTWKYIVDAVLTEREGIGQYIDSPWTKDMAEKLQERFGKIEQKPVEWSEEDSVMINKLCAVVNLYYNRCGDDLDKQSCIAWLKSLRPQKQWKPSEEQMVALYEETQKSNRIKDDRIVSLYNDLKNL